MLSLKQQIISYKKDKKLIKYQYSCCRFSVHQFLLSVTTLQTITKVNQNEYRIQNEFNI